MPLPLATETAVEAPLTHHDSERARIFSDLVDAINRNPGRVVLAISLVYFAMAGLLAGLKLLWFDEFITFYVAKLNGVPAIWHALSHGVDPNPPLLHILVMASMRLFGDGPLAVRLPAILGEWIGLFSLYVFLRRRVPTIFAAAGMCFFMATDAFEYSYEGRPYALTLGFAMLSLVAWRSAVEGRYRVLACFALAITLAAGLSSNYFAVLAFFPIAAGELVRNLERRKFELRVWLALAAGALPIVFYLPLINHAIAQFSPYAWNKPHLGFLLDGYASTVEVILWPALLLLAIGAASSIRNRRSPGPALEPVLPRHEVVAVAIQMAYPLIGLALAVARAGMISPRCVLPVCYGFAISVAVAGYRLFARHSLGALLLLGLCLTWAVARDAVCAYWLVNQRAAFYHVRDALPSARSIVVSDSLLVLPLQYYSPRQIASQIAFPLDFNAVRRYKKEDSPEENLWAGRAIFPVPILPLNEFESATPRYLIVASSNNWLLQKLAAEGRPAQKLPIQTNSKDITGFTPLCHGEAFLFDMPGAYLSDSGRHEKPRN